MKTCTRCAETQSIEKFSPVKTRAGNIAHKSKCRKCINERAKENRVNNPEQLKIRREKLKRKQRSTPETIICKMCGRSKDSSLFFDCLTCVTGKQGSCKKCVSQRTSLRYYSDPSFRDEKRTQSSERHRKNKYGMTSEMFNAVLSAQDGRCAICDIRLDKSNKSLSPQVDHCHSTGTVRGILCMMCNLGLGEFKDQEALLLRAVGYLAKYRNLS